MVSRLRTSCLMDLLAQRLLYTNLLEKMLETITLLHWRIAVDMPRIVTSDSLATWSSIFLFGSSRCYKIEGSLGWNGSQFWTISMLWKWRFPQTLCSAAGAIYVKNNFTQSNGTLTIANSSAKSSGGAVHLGAPSGEFRDVASAGFEAVVGLF